MVALVITAILTLGILAVGLSVRRARELAAAQEQLLVQSGFRPCHAEHGRLEEIVRSVRESARFEVRKAWKRATADSAVYWYEVASEGNSSHDGTVADEFLCTLARRSREPFLLYLRPTQLPKGFGSSLITKLLVVMAPAGLEALDLSQEPRSDGLLAAFGPKGTRLRDLLDEEQLELLAQGAQHGIYAIRGRDEQCTLELFGDYARKAKLNFEWRDSWSFVQRVDA